MITITKYIADDGKEFEDEYECDEYEHNLKCQSFVNSALLFDKDGNKLPLTEESAKECAFIVCKTPEAAEFLDFEFDSIMEEVCGYSEEFSAGSWAFLAGEWIALDDLIDIADVAKKILEL